MPDLFTRGQLTGCRRRRPLRDGRRLVPTTAILANAAATPGGAHLACAARSAPFDGQGLLRRGTGGRCELGVRDVPRGASGISGAGDDARRHERARRGATNRARWRIDQRGVGTVARRWGDATASQI